MHACIHTDSGSASGSLSLFILHPRLSIHPPYLAILSNSPRHHTQHNMHIPHRSDPDYLSNNSIESALHHLSMYSPFPQCM
ncbi:hypothetical protein BO79DRAFT_1901 [Aspergillus costaricaensis CBS 115574]|uniref:Uncharacterized protein n=1 Tax=Aspergillus costaricaensis CBS 115574 TaxID=1448317 RepID=A0ACD1IWK8_9EURO|nr:hypothetical protein BO79DRAFT_1901 [Aspergillus costaricaensis CBS 115574]RAK94229.1 hypothetical protein BO79DRAFT_1901 [Aspergillus costaricaensis CBS 115574]